MGGLPEYIEKRKFLLDMVMHGRIEDEFDIMGNRVKMRTLDSEENLNSMKESSGYDTTTKLLMIQRSLVARSIVSINGDWIPSYEEALTFLGKLPPVLVDVFWKFYEELKGRRDLLLEQTLIDLKKSSRSQSLADTGGSANSQSPSGSAPSIL